MKKLFVTMMLAMCVSAFAQERTNLGLIPTPQRVEVSGKTMKLKEGDEPKQVQVDTLEVEANMDQAYRLVVGKKGVTLYYTAEAGRENGLLTLVQLIALHGDELPCCTITDWPAYRLRGWMDDISRGPVTHAAYRQEQWETLHALKYNFCNYYTEHTLYQDEFPDLAPAAARTMRHPDEVINLQLFAHAEKTLRVPYYEHLKDSHANFNPDSPETYEFLEKRIAEAYRQLPGSPFFIIDCDETEQLGTGRARQLVDRLGADEVYVRHINRCYQMIQSAAADGTKPRVVMWGDIVAKNPRMMKQLPQDMTYIMWAYEPLDSYDHLIRPFKENGTPFWVAPSLSHSSVMLPAPQRYMKNIANLARDGYRAGAEGLMNTCWDDNGEALFDNCWHGLFWSAEMAWNPIRTNDPEELRQRERQFNENFERLFYGQRQYESDIATYDSLPFNVSSLYQAGAFEANPDVAGWYTSAALMEPLLGFNPDNTLVDTNAPTRESKVSQLLRNSLRYDAVANPHVGYFVDRLTCTMQKSLLRRMVYYRLHGLEPVPDTAFLREAMDGYLNNLFKLKREYLRLWDQENGEYERGIVCSRYDALAREVLDLDRHVFVEIKQRDLGPQLTMINHLNQLSKDNQLSSQVPMVTLRTLFGDRPIYYTLDGSEPTAASTRYTGPFALERSATVRAVCYNEHGEGVVSEQYLLSHLGMGADIELGTPYSTYKPIYSGGGPEALIDGQLGSNQTYADGHWQGYWGDSIVATLHFSTLHEVHSVSMRFMQNTFDWILAPTKILVYGATGNGQWRLLAEKSFEMDPRETGMRLHHCVVELPPTRCAHLRVMVPNPGPLPQWHPAPGQPSYLFADEIVVQ